MTSYLILFIAHWFKQQNRQGDIWSRLCVDPWQEMVHFRHCWWHVETEDEQDGSRRTKWRKQEKWSTPGRRDQSTCWAALYAVLSGGQGLCGAAQTETDRHEETEDGRRWYMWLTQASNPAPVGGSRLKHQAAFLWSIQQHWGMRKRTSSGDTRACTHASSHTRTHTAGWHLITTKANN